MAAPDSQRGRKDGLGFYPFAFDEHDFFDRKVQRLLRPFLLESLEGAVTDTSGLNLPKDAADAETKAAPLLIYRFARNAAMTGETISGETKQLRKIVLAITDAMNWWATSNDWRAQLTRYRGQRFMAETSPLRQAGLREPMGHLANWEEVAWVLKTLGCQVPSGTIRKWISIESKRRLAIRKTWFPAREGLRFLENPNGYELRKRWLFSLSQRIGAEEIDFKTL